MADEAAVVGEGSSPAQSPLVALSFQRNVNRKQKFLEAEPKALGITQIGLSVFNILCASVFLARGAHRLTSEIPLFVSSLLVAIAGSVAVAARNLHLPTLKACLGMQVVACVACVVNLVCTLVKMDDKPYHYWYYNAKREDLEILHRVEIIVNNFCAESAIIQTLLFAISAALAAYCCKVVNCCGAAPKMPVITVQAPPDQQKAGNVTSAEE